MAHAMSQSAVLDRSQTNLGFVESQLQKLDDDLKKLGSKVKHHEENLKRLSAMVMDVDEANHDLQDTLGNYRSSCVSTDGNTFDVQSEQHAIQCILEKENEAASIICQMKVRHGVSAATLPITKDVLGVVATLGKASDENLSRLFSEYLGLETMLAIVCKTLDGVKAVEKYDGEGRINRNAGLYRLGLSIGRILDGRFLVFCLENLRTYNGEFIDNDPQKRLKLFKPRLSNGEIPPGFLGFAVNMIILENNHLSYLTPCGHGLRETLFYNLFSGLQVYKTRAEMLCAMPCISDGAISLDGGMIKSSGLFLLGSRNDVAVRFPVCSGISNMHTNIVEIEEQIKLNTWKKERLHEDIQRESTLLCHAKDQFNIRKQATTSILEQAKRLMEPAQSPAGDGDDKYRVIR